MLSIEQALDLYTNKLTSYEVVDLEEFKGQMTPAAFAELKELAPMIAAMVANKQQEKFSKLWKKMNQSSDTEVASPMPKASGFRTSGNIDEKAAQDKLEEIFKAEFGDEA